MRNDCMSTSLTVLSLEQYVARHEAEFTFNAFLISFALPSAELLFRRSAFAIFLFLFCFSFFTLLVFVSLCAFWICRWVSQQSASLLHERCLASPPFWVIRARALGDVTRLATVCQSNAQFSLMMSHRTLVANSRSEHVLRELARCGRQSY